jgi:type IV pilus assembly protein PilA
MGLKINTQQKGFTLIEVLVVIGILAILLAITLIALSPARHFADSRNTQRASDVSAILNAIYEYQANNKGNLPPSVTSLGSTPTAIGNGIGEINLCTDIVPAYIADLPLDPGSGSKMPDSGTACAATTFATGYTIAKTSANRFTVAAPSAENTSISVTR